VSLTFATPSVEDGWISLVFISRLAHRRPWAKPEQTCQTKCGWANLGLPDYVPLDVNVVKVLAVGESAGSGEKSLVCLTGSRDTLCLA